MKKVLLFIFSCVFFAGINLYSQGVIKQKGGKKEEEKIDENAPGKFFATVGFVTNEVRRGLSQTDTDPHYYTRFGYNFGTQSKVSLRGGNASYPNESTHLNLRAAGSYNFDVATGINVDLMLEFDKFYRSTNRDGSTLTSDFNFFGYHLIYQRIDRWETTSQPANYFRLRKEFRLPYNIGLNSGLGYLIPSDPTFASYFDIMSEAIYQPGKPKYKIGLATTSNNGQFGSQAGLFMYIGLEASM